MAKLNIAHLHAVDQAGGGAKIVRNLHTELRNSTGFGSRLFVGEKNTELDGVIELPSIPGEKQMNGFIERYLSLDGLAAPSSFLYPKIIQDYGPDILHIHNIHGRYFNILNMKRLSGNIPLVWTFHDMWPLTGRCVHSYDCEKYTDTCHECPYLYTERPVSFDTTKVLHILKKKMFEKGIDNIIVPSKWMGRMVHGSFFDGTRWDHIPHGINSNIFFPHPADKARDELNLAHDSTIILFISNGLSNPIKGMKSLLTALNNIPSEENVSLLAVGSQELDADYIPDHLNLNTPGYIDNSDLPVAYSAADITVVPSLYESFGLVATESMACGTPVVAYETSGLQEQVTSSTGWLAKFRNIDSLSEKINEAIINKKQRQTKGENARKRVIEKYNQKRFINDHKKLYARVDANKN